ncbi:proton-coupled zinc antiporter SLC30A1 [Triplophysa rosa]|uniref:proton-coupled zinc antiporter SLC30A1 n=1 Tax=Triplophysa rosa TaxID=992332 RepID=UPI00254604AF|nr:proton-coupled zinc antiporter SLC30A1 [Triplophysa rosa]
MRLQPFGILISALLLASQCVSVSLEILTRLVQPEAIRHPFLSTVVGTTSLLFNILMFTWRTRNGGMSEAVDGIEFPGLIQTDLHSTSESKGIAVQDEALMFCNPEAPSVLNPDQSSRDCSSICSELQNHHVSKPVAELSQAQIHNSSVCESTSKVLQSTEEHVYSTFTDPTIPSCDQAAPPPVRSWFRRHFITVIQDLLCSALILVNGLVVLLMKPHCHRPHSDCHLLVYLDASFSTLVIVVFLAKALPKLYRYGLLVLQATPLHLCINEMRDSLTRVQGVLMVHELHVWQLSETYVVASVHVHCPEKLNAEECSDLMVKITGVLKAFGINHCTVQPEFLPSDRSYAANCGGDGPTAPVSSGCSLRCGQECAEKLCCSSQMDKSCIVKANSSTASENLRSICPLEESFSPPAPSSVGTTTDVIIENTYL